MSAEQLRDLKKAAKTFQNVLKSGDVTKIAEADVNFHDIINLSTGNQKLILILNNLREQMYRYRVEYLKNEEIHPRLIEEHELLIRAIENRDRERASELVGMHIGNQAAAITDVIRNKKETRIR